VKRPPGRVVFSLLALLTLATLAAPACTVSPDVASGLAAEEACHLNSECAAGLLCALGACRAMCSSAADCQTGGSCIDTGSVAACQYPAEKNTPCNEPSDCSPPLACASDYRCRNLCNSTADCNVLGITGRLCAKDAQGVYYCADNDEVSNGDLVAAPPPNAPTGVPVIEPQGGDSLVGGAPIENMVGPLGGTFGTGAVSVSIPPGALEQPVMISITPDAMMPGSVGPSYEIGPTGTHFMEPVTIAFAYTQSELGAYPPSAFAVATQVGGTWQAISQPAVDPYALKISGLTMHLSPYALVYQGGGSDAGTTDACTPSPFDVSTYNPSGSSSWTCIETRCQQELTACAADCDCNNAYVSALPCVQSGGSTTACFSEAVTSSSSVAMDIATCITDNQTQCAAVVADSGSPRDATVSSDTGTTP